MWVHIRHHWLQLTYQRRRRLQRVWQIATVTQTNRLIRSRARINERHETKYATSLTKSRGFCPSGFLSFGASVCAPHINIPASQRMPLKPSGHSQVNCWSASIHVAPLKHWFTAQSSAKESIIDILIYIYIHMSYIYIVCILILKRYCACIKLQFCKLCMILCVCL